MCAIRKLKIHLIAYYSNTTSLWKGVPALRCHVQNMSNASELRQAVIEWYFRNPSWLWNYCTIKRKVILSNALWSLVFSTTRPWNNSQEWWQVADLKHLKTSYIFSLPRISTKDFPYIKGQSDRSTRINFSSANFKWSQVFLCCQTFVRRGQCMF